MLGLLLADALLEEPRAEDAHGELAVLELRALVLRRRDDAGGEVRDAHRGLGLVHVLPAGAGRAVRVDAQVLGADLDLALVLGLRRRVDEREGGLAALLEVERRDAHQPMRSALGLQEAVGVVALDGDRHALEARLLARCLLDDLGAEAAALGPAQVHPQQHLGPVRGVGAADAGGDGEHGGTLVVRSGELRLEARARDLIGERSEIAFDVWCDAGVRGRERRELAHVIDALAEPLPAIEALAQELEPLEGRLRASAIVPEPGLRYLLL